MKENIFKSLSSKFGIIPFSSLDYPGKLSAVLFLQGCPWRCHYCHNSHLWTSTKSLDENDKSHLIDFLKRRQGLLNAIVLSGGEPLASNQLGDLIQLIKDHGYKVALHTGGAFPEHLEKIIQNLDWIGFDYKALFQDYDQITQKKNSGARARRSAEMIINSKIPYEFRTTLWPEYHRPQKFLNCIDELCQMKVSHFAIQESRKSDLTKSKEYSNAFFSDNFLKQITPRFEKITLRRN